MKNLGKKDGINKSQRNTGKFYMVYIIMLLGLFYIGDVASSDIFTEYVVDLFGIDERYKTLTKVASAISAGAFYLAIAYPIAYFLVKRL